MDRRAYDKEYSKLHKVVTKFLPLFASAVLGACMVFGGLAINNAGTNAVEACKAAGDVADAMSAILIDAQNATRTQPMKEAQRKAAMVFYDRAIRKLRESKC
jgi:hypothetical protein